MMSKKRYWPVISFSAIVLHLATHPAYSAELIRSRCHMNVCSWFNVESRELAASNADGALFKTTEKSWSSYYRDGDYDRPARKTGGEIRNEYYFCSRTSPSTMFPYNGKWMVTPIQPERSYGATLSATISYYYVCHGVIASGDDDFAKLARQFNYEPELQADAEQFEINQPLDVLKVRPSNQQQPAPGEITNYRRKDDGSDTDRFWRPGLRVNPSDGSPPPAKPSSTDASIEAKRAAAEDAFWRAKTVVRNYAARSGETPEQFSARVGSSLSKVESLVYGFIRTGGDPNDMLKSLEGFNEAMKSPLKRKLVDCLLDNPPYGPKPSPEECASIERQLGLPHAVR